MSDLWGYGWRTGAYDFSAPHGEFQMPVERNEQGHVRVHRGVVVPRHELDNPDHFLHDYGVHWSTNEQISQALSDPAVYGEHDDDVGLLLSGWYNPAHGTHSDPDPITGGRGYNEHEQEITMPPGTPIHVDRARWKHPDWNHDRWEDLGWSPGHHTAARLAIQNNLDGLTFKQSPSGKYHAVYDHENGPETSTDTGLKITLPRQVGMILVGDEDDEGDPVPPWVRHVWVHPDYQRRGIAHELWQRAGRPEHTPWDQSPAGKAWADAVGGRNAGEGDFHTAHRTAMPAPLPQGITFHHHTSLDTIPDETGYDEDNDEHWEYPRFWPPAVEARLNGEYVGHIGWDMIGHPDVDGLITDIHVEEPHRRHSIATGLFDAARAIEPKVHHSPERTDLGKKWVQYEESRNKPKEAHLMTAAVTVYTKPNCPQCTMTKKQLERLGVEHRVIDVTADPEAHAYVTGLGYQQAPVVVVGDGEQHWGGFRPDHLKELAND